MRIIYKDSEGNTKKIPINQIIQVTDLGTPNANNLGKIRQYIGLTTLAYTNGYFYKCVPDTSTTPATYKWEQVDVQPGGGGSADFPPGGTTGQALVKSSDADNDVEWGDMPNVPIEKITLNGTEQTITNKTVALTVIDNTVNNLVNYYKKTETYTQTEVNNLISAAAFGGFQVVSSLPTQDISTKTIYLIAKTVSETNNVYDEFIYVNDQWENIGDTEIDLTVYQTKNLATPITVGTQQYTTVESAISAINSAFASYLKTADFNTAIANYYTKTQVDAVTGDLTDLETTDKSSLVGAINELNTAVRPRTEIEISTANDFRSVGQGTFAFITTTAVTITLADANTVTIPANTQGFFDVGETDTDTNDYTGVIEYVVNDYAKTIYFNKTVFRLPASDSVQIDDVNTSTATTYSSAKIETVIGSSKASQMTGATAYQDGKAGLATKPVAGDNQKALFGDGRYHTIYAANTGSVVVVVTDEPTLYGRPVTLTAGTTTLTGTFDSTGECTFTNLALYGAVQVESTDSEDNPARGSTNLTYFGTYVVGIGFNFATLKLISSDISFAGVPVAIYYNGEVVAETSLRVNGYGDLEAIAYVEKLGNYKAVAVGAEKTVRASVTVTALRQTFTGTLVSGYLLSSNRDNIICEAYGDNFVDGSLSWGDGTTPVAFDLNGGTGTPTLQEDNSVFIPAASKNMFASVDLGAQSTPFTAYAVIKMTPLNPYPRIFGALASRSGGGGILSLGIDNMINISQFTNNVSTGVSTLDYAVIVLQFVGSGLARGYVYGYAKGYVEQTVSIVGQYVALGRSDINPDTTNASPSDVNVKYFAVVNEAESIQTVQANMEYLNTMFLEE